MNDMVCNNMLLLLLVLTGLYGEWQCVCDVYNSCTIKICIIDICNNMCMLIIHIVVLVVCNDGIMFHHMINIDSTINICSCVVMSMIVELCSIHNIICIVVCLNINIHIMCITSCISIIMRCLYVKVCAHNIINCYAYV